MIYSRFWGTEQNGINDDDKQQGPIIFWILLVADFFFFYGAASDFGIALNDEFYRYTEVVYDDDDDQPEAIGTLRNVRLLSCFLSLYFLYFSLETSCLSSLVSCFHFYSNTLFFFFFSLSLRPSVHSNRRLIKKFPHSD
jgi:hypothetical protein